MVIANLNGVALIMPGVCVDKGRLCVLQSDMGITVFRDYEWVTISSMEINYIYIETCDEFHVLRI